MMKRPPWTKISGRRLYEHLNFSHKKEIPKMFIILCFDNDRVKKWPKDGPEEVLVERQEEFLHRKGFQA